MLTPSGILIRLLHAQAMGVLIGLERERRDRPAGLRTHMVVALASATFMIVSIDFMNYQTYGNNLARYQFDPGRIAAYIVAGMGFLGAGTILRTASGVSGLTTAGTLWLVAALGMAAGSGMLALAWIAVLLALTSLVVLRIVEQSIDRFRSHPVSRSLRVSLHNARLRTDVLRRLAEQGVRVQDESFRFDSTSGALTLHLEVRLRPDADPMSLLTVFDGLDGVESLALTADHSGASLVS
jgi:putative Mg2+ transporter-C (MgtC) family protein